MRRLALILCAMFFFAHAPANAATEPSINPQQEARAVALQKELRCVVCQGESLDESNAPLAADLRRLIRARIAAGDSDEAVKTYLVKRYGDFILMQPPLVPGTYALWFGPLAVLLIGAGVVAFVVAKNRGKAANS